MIATENQNRIREALLEVFKEKGLTPPALEPDTILEQIGLESLDFAQVVIRMEEITSKDPFASGAEFQIKSLADLAAVYD
jgi:acyl carrier protein